MGQHRRRRDRARSVRDRLALQFGTRRYRAIAYWFLAYAIAIFGTGVSDFLHLDAGIPYAGTTLLWAVVLTAIFVVWYRFEGTLSIHSITTQRREISTGPPSSLHSPSGPPLGTSPRPLSASVTCPRGPLRCCHPDPSRSPGGAGLDSVVAFWFAYVVTRPLGASFADYISKPHDLSGIGFGDGPTALVLPSAVAVLVPTSRSPDLTSSQPSATPDAMTAPRKCQSIPASPSDPPQTPNRPTPRAPQVWSSGGRAAALGQRPGLLRHSPGVVEGSA